MQTQRDPLVFIALDYHVVNMHIEWILAVRTQHWKVKVSDNGCTEYWKGRRELLAALDHFYVGIFLRTAGLKKENCAQWQKKGGWSHAALFQRKGVQM